MDKVHQQSPADSVGRGPRHERNGVDPAGTDTLGADDIDSRAARLLEQVDGQRVSIPESAPVGADDNAATTDEPSPVEMPPSRPPGRQMAPPPWQLPTSAATTELRRVSSPDPSEFPAATVQPAPRPGGDSSASQSTPPRPPLPSPPGMPPPGWWPPPPPPGWMPPPHMPPPSVYRPPPGFVAPPSLDEATILDTEDDAPQSGWRRAVYRASAGYVNPGESRKQRMREDLLAQIRQPIAGDFRVAVLSIKGGVGKTTTTLGLGSVLAMVRSDRVIAVDANPDRGTLAERVSDTSTRSTVRDLITDPDISRYADVRAHTRMAFSRLEVLASEHDPAAAEVFGEAEYRRTVDILRNYYNVILTDCGTGIMHSAMAGVLDLAHSIVVVSSMAIDAARSASAALDWLMQHGHSHLVREAHMVLCASRPSSAALKLDKVAEHFEARCQSIHVIPFDAHLAEGADVDFAMLKPATFQAYLELAGAVATKFPRLATSRDHA